MGRSTRALLGLAILLDLASSAWADPLNIRIGWATSPSSLASYMLEKKDLLRHEGQSYTLEPIHFANSPVELTALASGAVDIGEITFPPLGAAIENAGMSDIRLIESQIENNVPGYAGDDYMVMKAGPIATIDDLKGKVLATNGIGAAPDIIVRYVMRRHGLELQRDYTEVEVAFANMKPELASGKIDMGMVAPPFVYDPELLQIARPLRRSPDEIFTTEVSWAARAGYIAKNRAALVDLIEDALRVTRWYEDPANHQEAVAIISHLTKRDPAAIDFVFTHRDGYRDPNGLCDLAGIQRDLDMENDLGLLKAKIDVTKFADLSLAQEASARLGK